MSLKTTSPAEKPWDLEFAGTDGEETAEAAEPDAEDFFPMLEQRIAEARTPDFQILSAGIPLVENAVRNGLKTNISRFFGSLSLSSPSEPGSVCAGSS